MNKSPHGQTPMKSAIPRPSTSNVFLRRRVPHQNFHLNLTQLKGVEGAEGGFGGLGRRQHKRTYGTPPPGISGFGVGRKTLHEPGLIHGSEGISLHLPLLRPWFVSVDVFEVLGLQDLPLGFRRVVDEDMCSAHCDGAPSLFYVGLSGIYNVLSGRRPGKIEKRNCFFLYNKSIACFRLDKVHLFIPRCVISSKNK